MAIFHLLNIADLFFMAAGVGIALLMIAMGGHDERRKTDRDSAPEPSPAPRARRR
jgi:hypothetical protein